ncbi:ATP-binding response regulator [Natrarchaeobius chitinivorans]|uniref:Hybrid sensor histidine kinase/response regulator n=1 Tax=Natrarchaeobius chitinivorans TaxID=1679083 RepID=A0A3N6PH51_NATCH|nr:response regulator [Natrarchaeobius chitinivorans]RQG97245.1 hybrid sensor histidine kinase/response regulator [Natrarchaeobius chitinivorans]
MTETSSLDVLLLEDNPDEAVLVERVVRGSGAIESRGQDAIVNVGEWHHAVSLEEAVDVLGRTSVDIVLSDLMVPDSRGVDTIATLVGHAPTVPIIALTSHDETVAGTQTIEAGAQDYIAKGQVESELVGRAIRYAIQRKQHELELVEANRRLALLNRIIGHDVQREMSVAVGRAGQLGTQMDADDTEAFESLNDALENVVKFTDAAADVVTLVEQGAEDALESRSIDAIVEAEVDRFTREHPTVEFSVDGTESEATVLATPMLGSVFEHLFAEAIRHHDHEHPRPHVAIADDDESVTVTIQGEGVALSDGQEAFLNAQGTPPEAARRMRTGLYLATTAIEQLGGTISVTPGPEIVVALERSLESDE